ncbi:MAG: hypothetical protein CMB97_01510 [Flavobacteriaceae bacterium]|nr:hypothetical protein [Flavobacteriaceae bacterium]
MPALEKMNLVTCILIAQAAHLYLTGGLACGMTKKIHIVDRSNIIPLDHAQTYQPAFDLCCYYLLIELI